MGASKPCRLRPAALADLEAIWDFTAARWSPDQADAYIKGISAAFERIGENPRLVPERTEFTPPVRIYRCEAHIIVYTEDDDHVSVVRIRHGHEDWASDPASGGGG